VLVNFICLQVLDIKGMFLPLVISEVYNSYTSGSLVDITFQVDELMRLAPELFLQNSKPDLSSTSSSSQPAPVAPKRLKVLNCNSVFELIYV